jgi:hypothetical protein
MNLTEEPEIVTWPETHYAFVEKIGPFQTTAGQAWQGVRALVPAISVHNQITGGMSLYKVGPKIYRAGFRSPHRQLSYLRVSNTQNSTAANTVVSL